MKKKQEPERVCVLQAPDGTGAVVQGSRESVRWVLEDAWRNEQESFCLLLESGDLAEVAVRDEDGRLIRWRLLEREG